MINIKTKKGVLFDFDGVLADTMQDNFLAWKKAFQDMGVDIKRRDYFPLEGMKLLEVARTISRKYCVDLDIKEIVRLKNKYYLEIHSFSFYKGVPELIDFLGGRKKLLGIVSASPKKKLEKTIPPDFLNKFDVIVSGDDTKKGKPHPEPYLVAMKKLNIGAEDCIIIENAPLGIKSAKAAGIDCIALTTTLDKKELKEADIILENHQEILNLFIA